MAKVTGYACDMCEKMETLRAGASLPDGWIVAHLPGGGEGGRKELCGSKCMRDLGAARYKAERSDGAPSERRQTPEGREAQVLAGVRTAHKRYHVDVPKPGCPVCQGEIEGAA